MRAWPARATEANQSKCAPAGTTALGERSGRRSTRALLALIRPAITSSNSLNAQHAQVVSSAMAVSTTSAGRARLGTFALSVQAMHGTTLVLLAPSGLTAA